MKKWDISEGLWKDVILVVIFLFVLSMLSCGGIKQFTGNKSHIRDSTRERVTITQTPMIVPLSQAVLRLNLADVCDLTPGAVFTEQNGQSSVRLERSDSIIIITAQCDSLQLLAESQTHEIYHLRTQLEQSRTEIEKSPALWENFKNNAFYVAVGMVFMLVIIFIKRICQRIRKPI